MPTVILNLPHALAHPAPGASNRWPLSLAVLARVTSRLAGMVAVVLVFAAGAAAAPLQTIVAFNPAAKETPENLAIAGDGTIYVSLAFASEIRRIAPDGAQSKLTIPTMGGITVGVAIDRPRKRSRRRRPLPRPCRRRHLARPACQLRAPDPDCRATDKLVPQRDRVRLGWEPLHRGLQPRRHLAARARGLTGNRMEREPAARADRRKFHELPPARRERHQGPAPPCLCLEHLDRQHSDDPDPARW